MLQVDTEELLERFLELFRVHHDSGFALIKMLDIYQLRPNVVIRELDAGVGRYLLEALEKRIS